METTQEKKPFWKEHFLAVFLTGLLGISVIWGILSNRITKNTYKKEIATIEVQHDEEIKTLKVNNIKRMISTLALAIRTELMNDNISEVKKYFKQTLKTMEVEKVLLVHPNSGEIVISTNQKDEGAIFEFQSLVNATEAITEQHHNKYYAATPIMGLNSQLGVLIIEILEE